MRVIISSRAHPHACEDVRAIKCGPPATATDDADAHGVRWWRQRRNRSLSQPGAHLGKHALAPDPVPGSAVVWPIRRAMAATQASKSFNFLELDNETGKYSDNQEGRPRRGQCGIGAFDDHPAPPANQTTK